MHKEFGKHLSVYVCAEEHLLYHPASPKGKWTNKKTPPKIGDRVNVIMNQFGMGTVVDYIVRDGWLGVKVKVDKQPEWSRKQSGSMNEFTFFGAEIKF